MTDSFVFEFGKVLSSTQQLQRDLRTLTARSDDPKVQSLAREVEEVRISGASSDAPPLTLAFVGQYNAGKSTIVSVLTGRADIVIDSDVCTSRVTAYDWNGVRLLDTPGIKAGYLDHDETTYAIIDRADLLVFVVTNELFDDTIGHHFRELAFARQHARRMLLVVNKMGQDPGSPDTKIPDLEKVTAPLAFADFRGVFIDARSWLEAQSADEEDRQDLIELANVGALTDALNGFIAEQGLTGRLSAPLFTMRGIAEQASALLSTDFPEERAALELLHRKRSIFLGSRGRLRTRMNGIIARAVADIGTYGDEVAESIEPGKTEKDVETLHAGAQARASARSEALSAEARACVEDELSELRCQLDALRDGVLARELTGQVEGGILRDDTPDNWAKPAWQTHSKSESFADWPAKAKKVGNVAKDIGDWAARWATGPGAEGASVFGTAAARGSDAHKVVYNVGKFFGVKFKPWGAVKVARTIGNAGRVISAVGGVLAVVAQIAEDRQQEQYRLQLRDARDGVRSAYRDSALSVQTAVWEQFESFLKDFYDSELLAIDETVEDLVGKRSQRKAGAEGFQLLERCAANLIDQITTKRLSV
ncbi:GTPase [Achromobacter xylosoxidans]|uniref:GTPase n=1 Tax=Alcaligenes xylosoxydans xylosoxydans TaxID=85698 RepID=UPI0006C3BDF8|nr:GTPase [Achromobacter xylosoxidans]MDH0521868.1 50S ribosome-binding GTPase [Achromobacter xylosoxidans]MDZ5618187.1 GTPase [Achromobacter xylosoxidans]MDZ5623828.1 GTPase [Achromobacter xylosoxidans]MDZ5684302.1 GTPase [Achromobacter xylosoxidans]CUJ21145.1 GTP-binding protein Der [Achromobacter xylosoxidans]